MPRTPYEPLTLDYEASQNRRPWKDVAIIATFGLMFAASCGGFLALAYGIAQGMSRLSRP